MNDTKGVQQGCGICLLLASTNRAKSHSTKNHRWSAHDHKILGENVSNPPQNSDRNSRQVHGGKAAKGNQTPSGETKSPGVPIGFQGTGNWTPSGSGRQPGGQENTNGAPGGGNRNQDQTTHPAETKKMPKDPRARIKKPVWGLFFRQGQGAWRRWRSLIRRPWPWKGQSSCGSGVRCRSAVRCRRRLRRQCLESSR